MQVNGRNDGNDGNGGGGDWFVVLDLCTYTLLLSVLLLTFVVCCSRWQRWFVGLHSASLRMGEAVRSQRKQQQQQLEKDKEEGRKKKEEEEEKKEEKEGTMMTMLLVDAISALYQTLLFDVKRG